MAEEVSPPFNRNAEESLIGSMLIDPTVRERLGEVRANDFHDHRCRAAWRVAGRMATEHEHIDIVTLSDRMHREGVLDDIGGPAWLTTLIARTPTSLGAEGYGQIVRDDSQRRVALQVASSIAKAALDLKTPPSAFWEKAASLVERAQDEVALEGPLLIDGAQLAALELPETLWLLPDHIPESGLVLLDGTTAAGKSWLAMDLAIAAASGGPALGRHFAEPRPVLYLGADSRRTTLVARFRRLCAGRGVEAPEGFHLGCEPFNLAAPDGLAMLRSLTRRTGAGLVVIDVFGSYLSGLDENAAGEVGPVLTALRKIANETQCAFVILHHSVKGPAPTYLARVRGSSAIAAAFDVVYILEEQGGARTLRQCKNRDKELEMPSSFRLIDDPKGGVVLAWGEAGAGADTIDAEIIRALKDDELNKSDIARATGRWRKTVFEAVDRLELSGTLRVRPGPRRSMLYRLAEATGSLSGSP